MSVYICVYLQRLSLDFFFFGGGEVRKLQWSGIYWYNRVVVALSRRPDCGMDVRVKAQISGWMTSSASFISFLFTLSNISGGGGGRVSQVHVLVGCYLRDGF